MINLTFYINKTKHLMFHYGNIIFMLLYLILCLKIIIMQKSFQMA